jgi:hypothetical protein
MERVDFDTDIDDDDDETGMGRYCGNENIIFFLLRLYTSAFII